MTEHNLRRILHSNFFLPFDEAQFKRMYEPDYQTFDFDENQLNEHSRLLVFRYKDFGFEFKSFRISFTGVEILLQSSQYDRISVNVGFNFITKRIFNYVLITPNYTAADWKGKKRISQTARIIYSDKGLKRYLKSLHARFECPVKPQQS